MRKLFAKPSAWTFMCSAPFMHSRNNLRNVWLFFECFENHVRQKNQKFIFLFKLIQNTDQQITFLICATNEHVDHKVTWCWWLLVCVAGCSRSSPDSPARSSLWSRWAAARLHHIFSSSPLPAHSLRLTFALLHLTDVHTRACTCTQSPSQSLWQIKFLFHLFTLRNTHSVILSLLEAYLPRTQTHTHSHTHTHTHTVSLLSFLLFTRNCSHWSWKKRNS